MKYVIIGNLVMIASLGSLSAADNESSLQKGPESTLSKEAIEAICKKCREGSQKDCDECLHYKPKDVSATLAKGFYGTVDTVRTGIEDVGTKTKEAFEKLFKKP